MVVSTSNVSSSAADSIVVRPRAVAAAPQHVARAGVDEEPVSVSIITLAALENSTVAQSPGWL